MPETDVTASVDVQNSAEIHKIGVFPDNTQKLRILGKILGVSGNVEHSVELIDSVENLIAVTSDGFFPFLQDFPPLSIGPDFTVNTNQSVTFANASGGTEGRVVTDIIKTDISEDFEINLVATVTTAGAPGDAGALTVRPRFILFKERGGRLVLTNTVDGSLESPKVDITKTNGVTTHDIDIQLSRVDGTIKWSVTDNGLVTSFDKLYTDGDGNKERITGVQVFLDVESNETTPVDTTVVLDQFSVVGDISHGISGAPGTGTLMFTPVVAVDLLTNGKLGDLSVAAGSITTWSLPGAPAGLAIAGVGSDEIHRTGVVTKTRDILVKGENATGYWITKIDLVDNVNIVLPTVFPALDDAETVLNWKSGTDTGAVPVVTANSIAFSASQLQSVIGPYCDLAAPLVGDFDLDAVLSYTSAARAGDADLNPNISDLLMISLKLQDSNGDVIHAGIDGPIKGYLAIFPSETETGNLIHFERRGTAVTGYMTRLGMKIPIQEVTIPATTVARISLEVVVNNPNGNTDILTLSLGSIAITDV